MELHYIKRIMLHCATNILLPYWNNVLLMELHYLKGFLLHNGNGTCYINEIMLHNVSAEPKPACFLFNYSILLCINILIPWDVVCLLSLFES